MQTNHENMTIETARQWIEGIAQCYAAAQEEAIIAYYGRYARRAGWAVRRANPGLFGSSVHSLGHHLKVAQSAAQLRPEHLYNVILYASQQPRIAAKLTLPRLSPAPLWLAGWRQE